MVRKPQPEPLAPPQQPTEQPIQSPLPPEWSESTKSLRDLANVVNELGNGEQ